jgi:hypothetical protein
VPTEVLATPRAEQQIAALARQQTEAFERFLDDLAAQGCKALAYRLTGTHPVDHFCVKHLTGTLRVIVAFETTERAWVLIVGPHTDDRPSIDVYAELYALVGIEPPDSQGRSKPPCCEAPQQSLPPAIGDALTDILQRARQTRRTRDSRSRGRGERGRK